MSATERMIAFHIARLKDKNAEVRLKSIHELELLNAVEAYGALEALFHSEPDPTVRDAARKVGYKFYKQMQSRQAGEDDSAES